MIHDTLANSRLYQNLPQNVADAIEYLRRTDFAQTADGRYELDGDRLVAIVRHCQTKLADEAVWETHRRHIDVHCMLEGVEHMGCLAWHEGLAVRKPYDAAGDCTLFDVHGELFALSPGQFVICMPDDVHASDLAGPGPIAGVRKVVMKCRVAGG
jgi:YhcH/YjgK/YiaL family protein